MDIVYVFGGNTGRIKNIIIIHSPVPPTFTFLLNPIDAPDCVYKSTAVIGRGVVNAILIRSYLYRGSCVGEP